MPLPSDKKPEAKLTKNEQDECLRISRLMKESWEDIGFFGRSLTDVYLRCKEKTLERINAGKSSPKNTYSEETSNGPRN